MLVAFDLNPLTPTVKPRLIQRFFKSFYSVDRTQKCGQGVEQYFTLELLVILESLSISDLAP